MSFAMSVSCTMHEEDREPIHHSETDSTIYILYNKLNQNVNIQIWNSYFSSTKKEIQICAKGTCVFSEKERHTFPQYTINADSCMVTFEDGTKIMFYPWEQDLWERQPISPINHIDSLFMHNPLRYSNCRITISNTKEGKQRVICEYEITEEDYKFAKQNRK